MGHKANLDNHHDYRKNFWFDFCIITMFIILKSVTLEKRFNELYPVVCKMWHRNIFSRSLRNNCFHTYIFCILVTSTQDSQIQFSAQNEQHLQSIMLSFFSKQKTNKS